MIVLKYEKKDGARFISHIDMLRHASRILRRAQIPVKFSQGFNPHALVFFSPPTAVGVTSFSEYIAIDTDMSKQEVFERYNNSVMPSLKAVECFDCGKNPNLQAVISAADYVFDTEYFDIDTAGGFQIEYEKKGQTVLENASDKIFGVYDANGRLSMRLASGNVNLRPDRVIAALNKTRGLNLNVQDVVKIEQFVKVGDGFVSADEYLLKAEKRSD